MAPQHVSTVWIMCVRGYSSKLLHWLLTASEAPGLSTSAQLHAHSLTIQTVLFPLGRVRRSVLSTNQSGLETKILASASKLWSRSRPHSFGLDLVVLLRNRAFFGQSVILKDAGTMGQTGTVIRSKWTSSTVWRQAIMGSLLSVVDNGWARHAAYGHATCLYLNRWANYQQLHCNGR